MAFRARPTFFSGFISPGDIDVSSNGKITFSSTNASPLDVLPAGAATDVRRLQFVGGRAAFGFNGARDAGFISVVGGKHITFHVGGSSQTFDATTEKMRVDSTGRIGINTVTPSDQLHVVGNTRVQSPGDSTIQTILTGSNISFTRASANYIDAATIGGTLQFRVSVAAANDKTAISINAAGQVGISNTGPQVALDVTGTVRSSVAPAGSADLTRKDYVDGLFNQTSRRYGYDPIDTGGTRRWVKLMTLDGQSASSGAHALFWISGTGDYGNANRGTTLIHFGQRGDNAVQVKAWAFGVASTADPMELYTKQISTYVFELWAYLADYNLIHDLVMMNSIRNTMAFNSTDDTGTAPTGLSTAYPIQDMSTPVDATKLSLTGGTLTGLLTLSGAPTAALHAATKGYVDGLASSTAPSNLGTAAATGSSTSWARSDHVHKLPNFADLLDTLITSPTTGQVPTWNGTKWVNQALPTAAAPSLASLTDTTITSPAANDGLFFDGTKWVNKKTNMPGLVYDVTLYGVSSAAADNGQALKDLHDLMPRGAVMYFPPSAVGYRTNRAFRPTKPITMRGPSVGRWLYETGYVSFLRPGTSFVGDALIELMDTEILGGGLEATGFRIENFALNGMDIVAIADNNSFPSGSSTSDRRIAGIKALGYVLDFQLQNVGVRDFSGHNIWTEGYTRTNGTYYFGKGHMFFRVNSESAQLDNFHLIDTTDSKYMELLAHFPGQHGIYITGAGDNHYWGLQGTFCQNGYAIYTDDSPNGRPWTSATFTALSSDRAEGDGIRFGHQGNRPTVVQGILTRRDGANGDNGGGGFGGILIKNKSGGKVAPMVINGIVGTVGNNDQGVGTHSPMYGIVVDGCKALILEGITWGVTDGVNIISCDQIDMTKLIVMNGDRDNANYRPFLKTTTTSYTIKTYDRVVVFLNSGITGYLPKPIEGLDVTVKNGSSGTINVTTPSGGTINGASSITIAAGDSCRFAAQADVWHPLPALATASGGGSSDPTKLPLAGGTLTGLVTSDGFAYRSQRASTAGQYIEILGGDASGIYLRAVSGSGLEKTLYIDNNGASTSTNTKIELRILGAAGLRVLNTRDVEIPNKLLLTGGAPTLDTHGANKAYVDSKAPTAAQTDIIAHAHYVILWDSGAGSRPARPAGLPAGYALYKGGPTPTDWLTGDDWQP